MQREQLGLLAWPSRTPAGWLLSWTAPFVAAATGALSGAGACACTETTSQMRLLHCRVWKQHRVLGAE